MNDAAGKSELIHSLRAVTQLLICRLLKQMVIWLADPMWVSSTVLMSMWVSFK